MDDRIQTVKEFIASNAITVDTIFGHTLGNDENGVDQLNAQIIRHQFIIPMKVIQSLLSLTTGQHSQRTLKRVVEQLKYKPRVMKEVLDDLDYLLRQESTKFFPLKRAMAILMGRVNEILLNDRIPLVRLMKVLTLEWTKLQDAIEGEKPKHDDQKRILELLNRMQSLAKCVELGIEAYKGCRNNPTKLTAYSAHVDNNQKHLQMWKEYEQNVYSIVIPVL